jgi:heat shock protein HslJ
VKVKQLPLIAGAIAIATVAGLFAWNTPTAQAAGLPSGISGTSWVLSTDILTPPDPSGATTLTFLSETIARLSGPCGESTAAHSWSDDPSQPIDSWRLLKVAFTVSPCDLGRPEAVNHQDVIGRLGEGLAIDSSRFESLPYIQLRGLSLYRTSGAGFRLLSDTVWQPISVDGRSLAGTDLNLRFSSNGKASGRLGCNGFSGHFAVLTSNNTNRLLITADSSAIGCGAEDVLAEDFHIALSGPSTFTVEGDTLTLFTETQTKHGETISPQVVVLGRPSPSGPAANTRWRDVRRGTSINYAWNGTIRVQTSCSTHEIQAETKAITRISGTCHKAEKLIAALASADTKTVTPIVWNLANKGNTALVRADLPLGQLSGSRWKTESGIISFTKDGRVRRNGMPCDWRYREIRTGVLGMESVTGSVGCEPRDEPIQMRNFEIKRTGKKRFLILRNFNRKVELARYPEV